MNVRPLIVFILFMGSSYALYPQQEISLSVKNVSTLLPGGGRIQAAANIGDLTLVAWGSVGLTRDSGGVVVLRSQLVRGNEPIASPRLLHGDSARPSGAVAVVPLRDRFLVLWNDVRVDRPGIYMRSMDTTGRPIGAEELFSTMSMDSTGMRVFGGSGMSHVLLWRTNPGATVGAYMREIGADGTPGGDERRIGTSITVEKSYSFLPHVSFIGVDARPVFAVIAGHVDPRPMPRSLFESPLFIGPDTSLATVMNDTFAFFFNAFDTSIYRRVVLDTMPGLIRGSIVVTTDGAGGSRLYFTTISDEPGRGVLRTYRQHIPSRSDPDGQPIQIDSMVMGKSSGWNMSGYQYEGIIRRYGCDNACYNDIGIYLTYTNSFGYRDGYRNNYRYAIDPGGDYHRGDTLVPDVCLPHDAPRVYRISSEGLSRIRLMLNDTTLLLTDTIPRYQLAEPRTLAGLIERNNTIHVAWKEATGLGRNAVARWSPGTDSVLSLGGIGKLSHVGRGGYANKDGTGVFLDEEVSRSTFSGASMAVNGSRIDYYDSEHDPNSSGQAILNTAVMFYVATPRGWMGATLLDRWEYPSQVRPAAGYVASSTNPDNGESVVAVTATWLPNLMLYGVNPQGGVIWSMEYDGAPSQYMLDPFIPAGPSAVLVCGHSAARLMVNGKATATIRYPSVDGAQYQRLFGEYFLRAYFTGDRMLRLERYRMDGREAGSNSIELRSHVSMPFIVQSRTDSSFALLYNDGQLRAAILDDSLRLVVDTVVASPSSKVLGGPVGIIRNDSLFVAWDDAHSGVADIYGTIVRIPRRRGTASVMEPPSSSMLPDISIAPLPANDFITITLPSGPGDASFEIRDALGLLMRRGARIASGAPLLVDVAQLPNGVYLVEIEAGGRSFFRRIVVLH